MSIGHQVFHPGKGLNATEIRKELDEFRQGRYSVTKWFAHFKHTQRAFEYSPRTGPTSTITIDQNIQVLQRIGIRDRQISVCRVAYDLSIRTITVYEIISNHLSMKKVSTR